MEKMKVILASQSPRRQELIKMLGWDYEIIIPNVDENIDSEWTDVLKVPEKLALRKALEVMRSYTQPLSDVVITADTLVILGNDILGKPRDEAESKDILRKLSGKTHQVVTGVCMMNHSKTITFSSITDVTFKELNNEDVDRYILSGKTLDKAGAYGIQDWIGLVGIESINGDYYNVMGLPVNLIYDKIREF